MLSENHKNTQDMPEPSKYVAHLFGCTSSNWALFLVPYTIEWPHIQSFHFLLDGLTQSPRFSVHNLHLQQCWMALNPKHYIYVLGKNSKKIKNGEIKISKMTKGYPMDYSSRVNVLQTSKYLVNKELNVLIWQPLCTYNVIQISSHQVCNKVSAIHIGSRSTMNTDIWHI